MTAARDRAQARILAAENLADRLARLADACDQTISDASRTEADRRDLAEIVFRGLPYAAVMRLALRLEPVRRGVELLPQGWDGWAR